MSSKIIVSVDSDPFTFLHPENGPKLLKHLQEHYQIAPGAELLQGGRLRFTDAGVASAAYEDKLAEFLAAVGPLLQQPIQVRLTDQDSGSQEEFFVGPTPEGVVALREGVALRDAHVALANIFDADQVARAMSIVTSVLKGRPLPMKPLSGQPEKGEGTYFRTSILVDVLSEDEPVDATDLSNLAERMDTGDLVGRVCLLAQQQLTPEQAVQALEEVGSDASFFESLGDVGAHDDADVQTETSRG